MPMLSMPRAVPRSVSALAAALAVVHAAVAVAGCGMAFGPYQGRASDTWTRSYPLSTTGEVTIVNANGKVEVEGVDGPMLDVRAERIAHGTTDALAKQLLPRITIDEHVTPDFVSIETKRIEGILIGASVEVLYHVRTPRTATVRATTVNGGVVVTSMAGRVIAQTTNGGVVARGMRGGLEARSVNGGVRAELASLGSSLIQLSTVNGGIALALPVTAKATVTATWANGGIRIRDLQFVATEQSRRSFHGRLNGGGTPIELRTVNGGITLGMDIEAPGSEGEKASLESRPWP